VQHWLRLRLLVVLYKKVVLLEFGIGETVIRRIQVDRESFEDALYLITPPHLREVGLPFEDNVLHVKRYVLAFWNILLSNEKLSSLMYMGQFLNTLTVTGYGGKYSVRETVRQAVVGEKRTALEGTVVGR
jgi:hypothetical protein